MTWLSLVALLVTTAGLVLRWKRPDWYWRTFGSLLAVIRVLHRFRETMEGCGLVITPPDWRVAIAYASRKPMPVPRAPRIQRLTFTRTGLVLRLKLRPGMCLDDFQKAADRLRHAFEMHGATCRELRPSVIEVKLTGYDVLETVRMPAKVDRELLRIPVALCDDGSVYVRDYRATPHELNVGANQGGKSTFQRAEIIELAKQPVALVGIDCKQGVMLDPLARRFSALAYEPKDAVELLEALVNRMMDIYEFIRREQRINADTPDEEITSDIFDLPPHLRPVPLVLFIDEIAELLLSTRSGKPVRDRIVLALVRLVQLGRAAGMYVEVCGQRFGSDLGDGVTLLRAQLTGRIAHRVNEKSTAEMTFGDIAEDALTAVQMIPNDRPGTAVAGDTSGTWHKIRAPFYTLRQAANVCNDHAHLTPDLPELEPFRPVLPPKVHVVKPEDVRLSHDAA